MYGMGGEVLEFEGLSVEQLEFFFFLSSSSRKLGAKAKQQDVLVFLR